MFFWCGRALREIKSDCLIGSLPGNGDEPLFILATELDDEARAKAKRALKYVEPEFRKVGLTITADTTQELITSLERKPHRQNFQWLIDQILSLEKLADKELHGKLFVYIPPERAKFWPTIESPNIFGDTVAAKFPSAQFDIANGGACLAATVFTAAVFHLMRVLEIGLTALGKVFNVSLAHTNWEPAIREIESKIRAMQSDPEWRALSDYKQQQQFYAQAASHFGVLKDAWRNYTMHARSKYTDVEAEQIFNNVRSFMQKLAERLHE